MIDRATGAAGDPVDRHRRAPRPRRRPARAAARSSSILAERYLAPDHAPEAVADALRHRRRHASARSPAEIARVAFDEPVVIDRPWTDFRGERHATMIGRPVAFTPCAASRPIPTASRPPARCTCCRSCSARSRPRAASASSRPIRSPSHAHPTPHSKVTPGQPLDGPHLGFPRGPEASGAEAPTAARRASTRPSPGKTRSRRTG